MKFWYWGLRTRFWIHATHHPTAIHLCAKYGTTKSKDKIKNPIDLEVKAVSGSWIYSKHLLLVIDPCAKYEMPMSKKLRDGPESAQTDRYLCIHLPELCSLWRGGGLNMKIFSSNNTMHLLILLSFSKQRYTSLMRAV